jgi:hypothetical protein
MPRVYTHFRYIAWQVPTISGKLESGGHGIPPGTVATPPELKGPEESLAIIGPDARVRIQRLIKAMGWAHRRVSVSDNTTTLKIFMVPEFYFRPNNPELSYTYEQYKAIKNVLRITIGLNTDFDDWLVIPGTIVWRLTENTPKRIRRRPVTIHFNTAIYIKNDVYGPGFNQSTGTITKSTVASGDHIADDELNEPAHRHWPDKYGSDPGAVKKHFFTIDSINIGLEICVEHTLRRLKKYAAPGKPDTDLHLLVSAGMQTDLTAVAAKKDGYFLRNDGLLAEKDGYSCLKRVEKATADMVVFNTKAIPCADTEIGFEDAIFLDDGEYRYPQLLKIFEACILPPSTPIS